MNSRKISTKTIARIAAVQLLYQHQIEAIHQSIEFLTQQMIAYYQDQELPGDLEIQKNSFVKIKLNIGYFTELVKYAIDNLDMLDVLIKSYLVSEWKIEDLQPLLLAILRVAICELKFFPEVPFKVVINEYTAIASDMLGDSETGFVNSVLDKIAKKEHDEKTF